MRLPLLGLLAACSVGEADPASCPKRMRSDVRHTPTALVSGASVMGAAWDRDPSVGPIEHHGAIVDGDGRVGPSFAMPSEAARGVAGATTVAWLARRTCNERQPFAAVVAGPGGSSFVEMSSAAFSTSIAFDGQRYQAFWVEANPAGSQTGASILIKHVTFDETGATGPIRTIAERSTGECLDASSDGAGTTLLRFDDEALIVDTAAGTARSLFTRAGQYGESFFFDGTFRIPVTTQLLSITSTATGEYTMQPLAGALTTWLDFQPMGTRLFVKTTTEIVEVDTALQPLAHHPYAADLAVFGMGLVSWDVKEVDGSTRTPGSIALTRDDGWRAEIATDSEVHLVADCGDAGL